MAGHSVGGASTLPSLLADSRIRAGIDIEKRWLVVSGAEHASFTDVGLLAEQLGIDIGAGLPAARVSEIVRRYTRAFLRQHLRHLPQPLLDKPSARYPQVRFCAPESGTCV
ncbi:hypothetical protein ACM9HC_03715 [Streptomyces sp. JAC18]|uniref:hypothetical protein n=1 Tax=Streptomyces sp. JAC18 TaxID=3418414 RepID=UPI003D8169A4